MGMGASAFTRLLPRPFLPPLWRELGSLYPFGSSGGRVPALPGAAAGQPVILVPGFLASDSSLNRLRDGLRAAGHQPQMAGIRWNVSCSEDIVARLSVSVERLAERCERRVALVGHSRGGMLSRVVAVRRPDLVSCVITLGAPYRDPMAIHPLVWASAATLATAGTLRVPGVLRWACGRSSCCADFERDLGVPLPASVGVLSVYSRRDGVVDWRACVDPAGGQLEVATTHCGMTSHAPTLWAVATTLADLAAQAQCR
jgi:triacylglycerol lipase